VKKLIIAILVTTLGLTSTNSFADGHGGMLMGFFAGAIVGGMVQSHYAQKQATQLQSQKQAQALPKKPALVSAEQQVYAQAQSYFSR